LSALTNYDAGTNMGICTNGGYLVSVTATQYDAEYYPPVTAETPTGLSEGGAIAIMVIGCILAIAIIVVGVWCWKKRKQRRQANAVANNNSKEG
jgi:uncharacterized iron-regulated membrane protein